MSRSSRIALILVAALCVLVIGYRLLQDGMSPPDTGATHEPALLEGTSAESSELTLSEPVESEPNLSEELDKHLKMMMAKKSDEGNGMDIDGQKPEMANAGGPPTITLGPGPSQKSPLLGRTVTYPEPDAAKPKPSPALRKTSGEFKEPEHPPMRIDTVRSLYTVQPGDTLSRIARERYGDESRWISIAELNPGVDPRQLRIGQTIRMPGSAPPARTSHVAPSANPPSANRRYLVRSGDTLWSITKRVYGSPDHWRLIYQANRQVLGGEPNLLEVGTWLTIPARKGSNSGTEALTDGS